jgi:hypothetical protein
MPRELVVSSPVLQSLEKVASMTIGDGFSCVWGLLMGLPMWYLIYFICLLTTLKILFIVLKRFGLMKKDPI